MRLRLKGPWSGSYTRIQIYREGGPSRLVPLRVCVFVRCSTEGVVQEDRQMETSTTRLASGEISKFACVCDCKVPY